MALGISGLLMNQRHTAPVRRFSVLRSVMPTSIPITSGLVQPPVGLKASTKPYRPNTRSPHRVASVVCRRCDREQVQDHQLARVLPPRLEKAALRLPSHREQVRVPVEHPGEVDPFVDGGCVAHDGAIRRQCLSCRQHTREQQGGVDGRQFAPPFPGAGARVDEVVEPAALVRHAVGKEAQRRAHARDGIFAWRPPALGGDTQCSQAEPRRGDAGDVLLARLMRRAVGARAVADLPGGIVSVFPEEPERSP